MATYEQLQITGYNLTASDVRANARRLAEVYKAALDEVLEEVGRFYAKVLSGVTPAAISLLLVHIKKNVA